MNSEGIRKAGNRGSGERRGKWLRGGGNIKKKIMTWGVRQGRKDERKNRITGHVANEDTTEEHDEVE